MKTAYTTHGLLFESKDVAIIVTDIHSKLPIANEVHEETTLIECGNVYVDGDFNLYDGIAVQIGSLSNGLEPEDLALNSHFIVEVRLYDTEEGEIHLSIKNRNFKLEHLSMELQERIHKVANEMYNDWLKVKQD